MEHEGSNIIFCNYLVKSLKIKGHFLYKFTVKHRRALSRHFQSLASYYVTYASQNTELRMEGAIHQYEYSGVQRQSYKYLQALATHTALPDLQLFTERILCLQIWFVTTYTGVTPFPPLYYASPNSFPRVDPHIATLSFEPIYFLNFRFFYISNNLRHRVLFCFSQFVKIYFYPTKNSDFYQCSVFIYTKVKIYL